MEFNSFRQMVRLRAPRDLEPEEQYVEYREDPLTGGRCRINIKRIQRPRQGQGAADIGEIVGRTKDCPFCPDNIDDETPSFLVDVFPEGHLKKGECLLFPNLYPLARCHAVATLTVGHCLTLEGFVPRMVTDNLACAVEFARAVHHGDGESVYPIYIWNHLPPSASSIVHPHTQVIIDPRPTRYQELLLTASSEYHRRHGSSFWKDVVAMERREARRYVGGNDSMEVIASFAPQGDREVQFIFRDASSLADLEDEQIEDFADAVIRVLRGYDKMGVSSFNVCTFSGPIGEKLPHYSLHVKIISRPPVQAFYRNDSGPLERLHYEPDIEMEPEAMTEALKPFFGE